MTLSACLLTPTFVFRQKSDDVKKLRLRATKHPCFIENADGSGGFYKTMGTMSGTIVSSTPEP